MQIHFERKDFLRQFRLAAGAVPTKDIKPILCNVKITASKKHGAVLHATDGESGIRINVDVDVSENGSVIVPAKRFRQILESTKQDKLTLAIKDNKIVMWGLVAGQWEFPVEYNPDDFPDVSDFTAESYHEICADDLSKAIKRTVFAIDKENPKYALAGVLFESESNLDGDNIISVVATCGRRMAVQKLYADCINDHSLGLCQDKRPEQTIVPVKTLQLAEKVLKSKSLKGVSINLAVGSVKMAVGKGTVTFHCGDVTVFSRLCEGRFPGWRGIIPKMDNALRAVVRSGELLSAVKSVEAGTDSWEPGVLFTFEPGRLTLEAKNREEAEMKAEIPVDLCGDDGKAVVKIDPKFLTSMLKTLDSDTMLTFDMNGVDPIIIMPGDDYQYLVMPMMIETTYRVEKNGVNISQAASEEKNDATVAEPEPDDEDDADWDNEDGDEPDEDEDWDEPECAVEIEDEDADVTTEPAKRSVLQDHVIISAIGFDDNKQAAEQGLESEEEEEDEENVPIDKDG